MPARNRPQSNAMLYTLITFVGLFIVATTAAVIFYVKFEDQRTIADQATRDLNDFASKSERTRITSIVGARQGSKSWLTIMVDYLESMATTIAGPLKDAPVEQKVNTVNRGVQQRIRLLAQEHMDIELIDPNTTGLIQIVDKLRAKLDDVTEAALMLQKQHDELQNRFDDEQASMNKTKAGLFAEKETYRLQVEEIKQEYDNLAALLSKNKDELVRGLNAQVEQLKDQQGKLDTRLLQMDAKLSFAEERIAHLQKQIEATMPPLDPNMLAYQPDGKVIVVDNQIVHIDKGRDDHVYVGLKFAVYNKGLPIPPHGKGKAEIEVFDVSKSFSAARVLNVEKTNPILQDDIVANLIWDRKKANLFMIAGDFDLNSDGSLEYDAVDKIKSLVLKWGGRVTDTVTVDTDYIILGQPPRALREPAFDEMERDPLAMQKYEASMQKLDSYNQVRAEARSLYIPVLNAEKFLYFIGYKSESVRPGAFD
ncbi:MAG: zinc ribbon domain-containing protein [Planctomycetota bacterium]